RPDRLMRQEVAERESPDHGRDEQGLNDRDAAPIERRRLQHDADDLRGETEQPQPPRQEHEQRSRMPEGDSGEAERRLLPEGRRERKAEGREESEHRCRSVHVPSTCEYSTTGRRQPAPPGAETPGVSPVKLISIW